MTAPAPLENAIQSPTEVKQEDKMEDNPGANGHVDPGVSLRFGPVQDKDVDMKDAEMKDTEADANGIAPNKRKARPSSERKSYAESESEEEVNPSVRYALPSIPLQLLFFKS